MSDHDAPAASAARSAPVRAQMRTPTLAHRVEYGALRSAIGVLGAMRWRRAVRAGAAIGRLAYEPFGVRRNVVESQIAAAFPEASEREVRSLARGAFEHLGRVTVETALLSRVDPAWVLELFESVEGWDVVERLRAKGKGLIMVTGHLGNWELGGAYIAARGVPLDVVVRRMGNPLFDGYLTRTRSRLQMAVVRDRDAVRRTPRTLRAGGAVAFLTDQAGLNLASTFVPFFGRPAKTPRGPAVFALRLDAPMVFGTALRLPTGRYRLVFEEVAVPESGDVDRDVDELVARYTDKLEQWVRRAPEQYFWQHHRWKRQPEDTPEELRDPVEMSRE
jgi:KDO2-lipid IV(A) lauroyltransferase